MNFQNRYQLLLIVLRFIGCTRSTEWFSDCEELTGLDRSEITKMVQLISLHAALLTSRRRLEYYANNIRAYSFDPELDTHFRAAIELARRESDQKPILSGTIAEACGCSIDIADFAKITRGEVAEFLMHSL